MDGESIQDYSTCMLHDTVLKLYTYTSEFNTVSFRKYCKQARSCLSLLTRIRLFTMREVSVLETNSGLIHK